MRDLEARAKEEAAAAADLERLKAEDRQKREAAVGLLVYALASNPKVCELGRLAYFAGLLVTVWELAGDTVRLVGHH